MMNQFSSQNIVGAWDGYLNFDYQDLDRCERVARFLAEELKNEALDGDGEYDGPEFDDPLELIAGEMADLPGIITDVKNASQAFDRLEAALGRMFALADRASEEPERGAPEELMLAEQRRALLDEEFARLAKVVAGLAGRDNYQGPALSLKTPAQAQAARKILAYLHQTRLDFSRRLYQQRRLINEVVRETIKTLGQLAAMPGADPASKISSLLVKIDLSEPGLASFNQSLTRH